MPLFKKEFSSNFLWAGSSNIYISSINFIFKIVLARLLLPDDFGIFALAFIVIDFSMMINEAGLSSSIVQIDKISSDDKNTAFWGAILIGSGFTFLMYFLAPNAAMFFSKPELTSVLQWLSWGFLFGNFQVVPMALLKKELQFKRIAIVENISVSFYGIFAIILALNNFGIWSLVYSDLLKRVLLSFGYFYHSSWKPGFNISVNSFRNVYGFGIKILFLNILSYFSNNSELMFIGKLFDATSVGFYNMAFSIATYPYKRLTSIILRVAFPLFSKLQNDIKALQNGYLKVIKYITLINFPLIILIFMGAPHFIDVFLGEKWLPIVPFVQLFAIVCYIKSFSIFEDLFVTLRKMDLYLKLYSVYCGITFIFLCVGVQYGIIGIVLVSCIRSMLFNFVCIMVLNNHLKLSLSEFLINLKIPFIASIITVLALIILNFFLKSMGITNHLGVLVSMALTTLVVYLMFIIYNDKMVVENINRHIILKIKQYIKNKALYLRV